MPYAALVDLSVSLSFWRLAYVPSDTLCTEKTKIKVDYLDFSVTNTRPTTKNRTRFSKFEI